MTGFLLFVSREGIGWAHYENQTHQWSEGDLANVHRNWLILPI